MPVICVPETPWDWPLEIECDFIEGEHHGEECLYTSYSHKGVQYWLKICPKDYPVPYRSGRLRVATGFIRPGFISQCRPIERSDDSARAVRRVFEHTLSQRNALRRHRRARSFMHGPQQTRGQSTPP